MKTRAGGAHDFRLQLDDLKRHVAILGMTGSGKSTSAAVIVRQVAGMGLPVTVLDWHNEHADAVRSIGGQVLSPGKDKFTINPLDMTSATRPRRAHRHDHGHILGHLPLHPPAGLHVQERRPEVPGRGRPSRRSSPSPPWSRPSRAWPLRSAYDNETKVALLRRLVPLTEGQVGRALNGPSSHTVDELLDKVLCVELGHIRDTQTRSVFVDILLKVIYEHRMSRQGKMEHLLVIEEARNIAPARREEDPPSVGERMVSELRKFGEAMVFVAQFPTQVASEVIKNSGVRIIHRVSWAEDLKLIGEALNLSKEQLAHVSNLGVGEAVVSLTRLQKPILVQVDAASFSQNLRGAASTWSRNRSRASSRSRGASDRGPTCIVSGDCLPRPLGGGACVVSYSWTVSGPKARTGRVEDDADELGLHVLEDLGASVTPRPQPPLQDEGLAPEDRHELDLPSVEHVREKVPGDDGASWHPLQEIPERLGSTATSSSGRALGVPAFSMANEFRSTRSLRSMEDSSGEIDFFPVPGVPVTPSTALPLNGGDARGPRTN